jgi:hypothetical protein
MSRGRPYQAQGDTRCSWEQPAVSCGEKYACVPEMALHIIDFVYILMGIYLTVSFKV